MDTQIKSKIKEKSNVQQVLEWLQAGKTITKTEAKDKFGELYLSGSIRCLRKRGYKIYYHYPNKKNNLKEGFFVMDIQYENVNPNCRHRAVKKYHLKRFGFEGGLSEKKFYAILDYLKKGNKLSMNESTEIFKVWPGQFPNVIRFLKLNGYKYKVEYTKSKNNKKVALYSLDKDETNN